MINNDNVFLFQVTYNTKLNVNRTYEVTAEKDGTCTLSDKDIKLYLEKCTDNKNFEKVSNHPNYTPLSEDDSFGAKQSEMVLDIQTANEQITYYYKLLMYLDNDYSDNLHEREY